MLAKEQFFKKANYFTLDKIFNYRYASVEYHQSGAHNFDPRSVDQRQSYSEMEISEIARNLREVHISPDYIFLLAVLSLYCIFVLI